MSSSWDKYQKEIRKQDEEAETKAFLQAISDMGKEDKKLADLLQQTSEQVHKEAEEERKAKAEAEAEKKKKENAEAEKLNPFYKALNDALPHY